jgi:hypothetical protein
MAAPNQSPHTPEGRVTRAPDSLNPVGPAWKEAEAAGFDMSLVEENLRMTPWERMVQHDRALRTAIMLREAMEKHNGRR